jgi:hypothetical protein
MMVMKKLLLGLALAQSIQKPLELRVNGTNAGKAYMIAGQTHFDSIFRLTVWAGEYFLGYKSFITNKRLCVLRCF